MFWWRSVKGDGQGRPEFEDPAASNFGPRIVVSRMRSGREAQPRCHLEVTVIAREKSCLMMQHDTGDETIAHTDRRTFAFQVQPDVCGMVGGGLTEWYWRKLGSAGFEAIHTGF